LKCFKSIINFPENQSKLEKFENGFFSFIVPCPIGTTNIEVCEENDFFKALIWISENEGLEEL
jgi:hypothetical protein